MKPRTRNWIVVLSYVAFIYATLELVRIPTNALRSMGILRITLFSIYVVGFITMLGALATHSRRSAIRYVCLGVIFGLYPVIARWVTSPEEQIHFLEYGLVGVLFYRAVAPSPTEFHAPSLAKALLLATIAGWIDELLQGLMPSRHYDLRDVFLNLASAALGLGVLLVFIYPTRRPTPLGSKPAG